MILTHDPLNTSINRKNLKHIISLMCVTKTSHVINFNQHQCLIFNREHFLSQRKRKKGKSRLFLNRDTPENFSLYEKEKKNHFDSKLHGQ